MALRDIERKSIRDYLASKLHLMRGDILDLGAGEQPYRDLISPAGRYYPWDADHLPDNHSGNINADKSWRGGSWDTIICTQVLQYVPDTLEFLEAIREALNPGGVLVMTGPTNWPVVQPLIDLRRWTTGGIMEELAEAGFVDIEVQDRAAVRFENEYWSLGWGATARPRPRAVAA